MARRRDPVQPRPDRLQLGRSSQRSDEGLRGRLLRPGGDGRRRHEVQPEQLERRQRPSTQERPDEAVDPSTGHSR